MNRNHPVLLHWVSPEEAARFPLRKPPPPGRERLRIVEIPGIDASACGGLHTASTGEVGLILFGGQEKIRGRVRLAWKIGERAWRELRAQAAGAGRGERRAHLRRRGDPRLGSGLERRGSRPRSSPWARPKRRLAALRGRPPVAEAAAGGGIRLVCHRLEGESPGMLPALFQALVAHPRTVACLGGPAAEGSMPWLVGSSEDLDVQLEQILPPLLPMIEGKGGGRGRRWQGSARRPQGWPELCAALAGKLGIAAADDKP